mmetsp:Transcript_7779/g.22798  ORF Transcript_7779/g.22798 Transcript_7779/m.22798 type:complete len:1829 (+) Transcript_7779:292-5778(+)
MTRPTSHGVTMRRYRTMSATKNVLLSVMTLSMLSRVVQGGGIQSGPSSGPFYAGGMYLDQIGQKLYMTGIHYTNEIVASTSGMLFAGNPPEASKSSCFIASMRLEPDPSGLSNFIFDGISDWTSQVAESDTILQETCTAIAVHKPSQIVVIGTKENGSANTPPLAGNLAVYSKYSIGGERLTEATLVSQDNKMQRLVYPVAITPDRRNSDYMYMVVLASLDAVDNTAKFDSGTGHIDWLKHQKYGSSFEMHVSKIQISQGGDSGYDGILTGSISASKEWTTEFPLDATTVSPPPRVFVGGVIHKTTSDNRGLVIVVGSTRGTGTGYGLADGNDEDGFVTVLDPTTGSILGDGAREGSPKDDIVTGICDDVSDPDHFFIVGGTLGKIGRFESDVASIPVPTEMLSPFLRQVKTDRTTFNDDDNLWTVQWAVTKGSTTKAAYGSAIGCVVHGDYVYVAGTVDNGASIVQDTSIQRSQGGDDVWISKIHKDAQTVEWMTQLGSSGNDRLARYGGITVDRAGNPILYGDTTGSIYRKRGEDEGDGIVDMFVMTIDRNTGKAIEDDEVSSSPFYGGISHHSVQDDDDGLNPFPTLSPTYLTDFPSGNVPTEYPTYLTDFPTTLEEKGDEEDEDDDVVDVPHFYKPVGLQIFGPGYAGGITYDSQENTVLLTGATYKNANMEENPASLCFIGVVDLDTGNLKERNVLGSKILEGACNAVSFDANRNAAYAIGVAETGADGKFDGGGSAWLQGEANARSGGLLVQVNENVQLLGGNRIVDYPAVYPISIVTDPLDKDSVFVASMVTKETTLNSKYSNLDYPNFMEPENHKFGSQFFLMVDRYRVTKVPDDAVPNDKAPNTLEKAWMADFQTDDNDLLVGGMVMAGSGNVLVIVGSTQGGGGPFERVAEGKSDMDGFILKIDPETGKLTSRMVDEGKASTRLDSVNKKDDWILNVCNDRFDHDSFYVVGRSMGKIRDLSDDEQPPEGSSHAYVAKVDLKTLGAKWLKHFTMVAPNDGKTEGEALACTVTRDSNGDNVVYVGGTVKNGAVMNGRVAGSNAPFGNDDIFVAAMNGGTGTLNWIKQVGTAANDRLASGQGLDVDAFGNVIVFGETSGDFYDEHSENGVAPDLVVFTMNKKDGYYLPSKIQGKGVGADTPDVLGKLSNKDLPDGIVAIQTDEEKIPSYAGGMYYDQFTNAVFLTGATYTADGVTVSKTSRCIFAIATLPQFQWKQNDSLGTNNAPEACSSLSLANYRGKSEAIVVGSAEPSGLLDNLRTTRRGGKQYGLVLDLANRDGTYNLVGGAAVDDEKVQYPIKVLADNEKVFMVSMASKNDEVRPEAERADSKKYPNFTSGGITKFGSQYEILVESHTINRGDDNKAGFLDSTMQLNWRKPLETADQNSIFVSGMAMVDEGSALVVVGSTQGTETNDDFDGIMAKISTNSGQFASDGAESRSVAYFSSVSGSDDWVLSVCSDPDEDRFFYVTGATGGVMDDSITKAESDLTVHAVLSKIEANTLNILWTTQYQVSHPSGDINRQAASVGLGCAKVTGKGHVYIAGDVENGAILEGSTESAGGDDIFVAMVDASNGKKIWTKQVGSSGDDRIARGGGIAVDANGNAVVYGDTTGDFHRNRGADSTHTSDLFLMIFNHDDGVHQASLSKQSTDKTNNRNNPVESNKAPTEWFPSNTRSTATIALGSIAIVVFLTCTICSAFLMGRRSRNRADVIKKNSIFTYLQKFNVEDVDLRKSPAGGWHGTYLNKLAFGVNTNAALPHAPFRDEEFDDDENESLFESAKMVHKKNKKGSLFSNSSPVLGGGYRDDDGLRTRDNGQKKPNEFSIV